MSSYDKNGNLCMSAEEYLACARYLHLVANAVEKECKDNGESWTHAAKVKRRYSMLADLCMSEYQRLSASERKPLESVA